MTYLEVPETLTEWGIASTELEKLVELMAPMQNAFDQNPVPFSAYTDARTILEYHI